MPLLQYVILNGCFQLQSKIMHVNKPNQIYTILKPDIKTLTVSMTMAKFVNGKLACNCEV